MYLYLYNNNYYIEFYDILTIEKVLNKLILFNTLFYLR